MEARDGRSRTEHCESDAAPGGFRDSRARTVVNRGGVDGGGGRWGAGAGSCRALPAQRDDDTAVQSGNACAGDRCEVGGGRRTQPSAPAVPLPRRARVINRGGHATREAATGQAPRVAEVARAMTRWSASRWAKREAKWGGVSAWPTSPR